MTKILLPLLLCIPLSGCVGTLVGTTIDLAVASVKVPVKVGGAVVGAFSGDDNEQEQTDANN